MNSRFSGNGLAKEDPRKAGTTSMGFLLEDLIRLRLDHFPIKISCLPYEGFFIA